MFSYPFKNKSAEDLYQNYKSRPAGFYPVGSNGFWHSGIHLQVQQPVVSIADGEVIAYRIDDEYIPANKYVFCKNYSGEHQFSSGFVLIKHEYKISGQVRSARAVFLFVYAPFTLVEILRGPKTRK